MKIGIIETGLPPHKIGGAELQAWRLAHELSKDNQVTLFVRKTEGAPGYECHGNITIYRVSACPYRPFGIISYILGTLFRVFRCRKEVDLLLCFRAWPNGVIGLLAKYLMRIPSCFSIRGGDWYFVIPKWWGRIIYRFLFSSSMPVVVQSKKIQSEIMAEYSHIKPLIIPNGVEQGEKQEFSGKSIIFVGNLIPRKGVDCLIEAVKDINHRLIIIGDGPERNRLKEMSEGLDIEFKGRVGHDEVRSLMKHHGRIFVLPAVKGEGFPNVLLEAMSVGVPVIASDVAGVADILENGKAGVLVEPGNVETLRNAINSLLQDRILRERFAEEGYKAAQKYSWENVSRCWINLFDQMLQQQEHNSNKTNDVQ